MWHFVPNIVLDAAMEKRTEQVKHRANSFVVIPPTQHIPQGQNIFHRGLIEVLGAKESL